MQDSQTPMKSSPVFGPALQAAVVAIVLLGMLGGSLIVAHSGFGTSPRHGGPSTFVPAPQAYFLAAILYVMSAVGMLALLQSRGASRLATVVAVLAYAAATRSLVAFLAPD